MVGKTYFTSKSFIPLKKEFLVPLEDRDARDFYRDRSLFLNSHVKQLTLLVIVHNNIKQHYKII